MTSKYFSKEQKVFYQNLKKSLKNQFTWVTGSTAATTDLVVLDIRKDIQLYKIIPPSERKNVIIWLNKLKKIYTLAWYKADYVVVYVDENFNEQKREVFSLN